MHPKLHANAATTPRTRAYIQQSHASNTALARQLGIHSRTVARWKSRQDVADRSTRPQRLATTMTAWEEGLIVELRRSLALPLDDILEAMRRCLNPKLSRSCIHRCLQRHRLSARLTPPQTPAIAFQTDAPAGFIHIDVKYLPPLNRRRSYAYVAIDRATRFVYLEILPDRRATTAAGFLTRFLDNFPLEVHTTLTDNGSEFTDRFAVDKKAKPQGRPSGDHAFDRVCAARAIAHRLTQTLPAADQRHGRALQPPPRRASCPDAAKPRRPPPPLSQSCRTRCLPPHLPRRLLAGHNTKAGAHCSAVLDNALD